MTQIATNQLIYNRFSVWVQSSEPNRCPTYSQIVSVNRFDIAPHEANQLVKLNDITLSAAQTYSLTISDFEAVLAENGIGDGEGDNVWTMYSGGMYTEDECGVTFIKTPNSYYEEFNNTFEATYDHWYNIYETYNASACWDTICLTNGTDEIIIHDPDALEAAIYNIVSNRTNATVNWGSDSGSSSGGSSSGGSTQGGTMNVNVRVRLIGFRDSSDESVFGADPLNVVITNDSGQTRTFSSPYIYEDYESANSNDYSINLGTWSGMTYTNLSNCSFAVSVDNGYTTDVVKTYVRSIHNGQAISPIISGSELDSGYVLKGSLGRTWTGIEIVICANEDSIPLSSYFIVENPWPISTKNPNPNDYFAFESPKITHKQVTIMRIRPVHKTNFNLWIRSYAESSWDFTIAGRINNALSSDYTAYSSTNPGLAWTKSNQKSGYTEADHTAVSYSCSYYDNNFVDIAYRKDTGGNYNDDKGYCLMHYSEFY